MSLFIAIISTIILLCLSALISASEVALFSLSPRSRDELRKSFSARDKIVLQIYDKPKLLLATILIASNLVNIGIVLISEIIAKEELNFISNPIVAFLIQVIAVTFLILLFGEVIPKVFANQHSLSVSRFMAYPVSFLEKFLFPLSSLLIVSTSFIDKKVKKKMHTISVEDLSHALDLTITSDTPEPERKILRGIVKFGQVSVKQIMVPRMDITGFEFNSPFKKLMEEILASKYSRVPIYKETIDKISGILYVKDLLPYLDKEDDFKWQTLIREPFFVPENKKNDDLLKEFQHRKTHMAIVVDEFGGTSGIVTLEDVIEEIVGEINDEFDDDELVYSKLDDNNYVFEGKISLSDLSRKLSVDSSLFELPNGREADTLAGFLIEFTGNIPKKGEEVKFSAKGESAYGRKDFIFTVESADNRKIKRVKVTVPIAV
ncbi:MAG: gliding motility-associated protein GldE [Bacteroidetes bacterium]|nr:gliding motility-associated protein GldE [Bacteroidota bacterium]